MLMLQVIVDDPVNVGLVKAFGPGLNAKNCRAGVQTKFTIDASKSRNAPVAVNMKADQRPLQKSPEITDNGDGTYNVTYIPPHEGSVLQTQITYNGVDIPDSPYKFKVRPYAEPEQVKITGPCLSEPSIPASIPTTLKIDTNDAGYGDLEVRVVVSFAMLPFYERRLYICLKNLGPRWYT